MRTLIVKDAPHRVVEFGDLQRAVLHQPGEVLQVGAAGHIHIEARVQGAKGGVTPVTSESLNHEIANRHGVADDETL